MIKLGDPLMFVINNVQQRLEEWQSSQFGKPTKDQLIMGMADKAGCLAHYELKRQQKIREGAVFNDDQINDIMAEDVCHSMIYGINLLTELGYPADQILTRIVEKVMSRDWNKDPEGKNIN